MQQPRLLSAQDRLLTNVEVASEVIVLSSHADDVALSCAGILRLLSGCKHAGNSN